MNSDSEKEPRDSKRTFVTTSWSMVAQAADSESPEAQNALAELCEAYWYPLYAFVRRKGHDRPTAEDLTQAFFAELLEKQQLAVADENRGRFRTFLLAALQNFISNRWRHDQALKRGGEHKVISFDFAFAETQFQNEPIHQSTPQKLFERSWALAVLEKALNGVRQQYEDSGKAIWFEHLKVFLGGGQPRSYRELASELDTTEGAIKVAIHRLRERYGQQLRIQIAKTVDSPDQVDQELALLFESLKLQN